VTEELQQIQPIEEKGYVLTIHDDNARKLGHDISAQLSQTKESIENGDILDTEQVRTIL
jgi:hypothetical protein